MMCSVENLRMSLAVLSQRGIRSHFLMVLRDRLVRRAISLIDNCSRKYIRRIFAYMIMVITL